MIRAFFSLLAGALVLVGPTAALADTFSPSVWHESYRSLPLPDGEPPEAFLIPGTTHSRQLVQHPLPFPVIFDGEAYTAVNIGMKGYVSFHPSSTNGTAGSSAPEAFERAAAPERVLAAWWADNMCRQDDPAFATQTIGFAPDRIFVIQWHCGRRNLSTAQMGDTLFQTQLWLFEGKGVFQARYGDATIGTLGDWTNAAWGVKPAAAPGIMGPDRDGNPVGCSPDGVIKCRAADFPRQATIQYGFFEDANPVVRSVVAAFTPGDSTFLLELDAEVLNPGLTASDLGYQILLSPNANFVPGGVGNVLLESGLLEVDAAQGTLAGKASMAREFTAAPPPGRYHACLHLTSGASFGAAGIQSACAAASILWGPDLSGAIEEVPLLGMAGDEIAMGILLRNQGLFDAGSFGFSIIAEPDELPPGSSHAETVELFRGRLEAGLAVGEEVELRFDGVDRPLLRLPNILRGDRYSFVLLIDTGREIDDVDLTNNRAYASVKMETLKPLVQIQRGSVQLSLGYDECIYGEPMEASLEICNGGRAAASNFNPGVRIGSFSQVSFLEDPVAASAPQTCHSFVSPNHRACEPVGGRTPLCVQETCRLPCESDAECGGSLFCREDPALSDHTDETYTKSCTAFVDFAGSAGGGSFCQRYQVKGVIPKFDRFGQKHPDGEQRFHFLADTQRTLSETATDVFTTEPFFCQEALPDLEAVSISPPAELIAGDAFSVTRLIRNRGYVEGGGEGRMGFSYHYYLAPEGAEISPFQIPLVVQSTGGAGFGTIERKSEEHFTDVVVVPAHLRAGDYRIGLVVDHMNEIREMSEANNIVTFPGLVRVSEGSLRIVTKALPAAVSGSLYTFQFAAVGGASRYSWSGSNLPMGLSIDPKGLLRGAPWEAGVYAFDVRVTAGDRTVTERVALEVLELRADLEVSTATLPPAGRGRSYGGWIDGSGRAHPGVPLAASGGLQPYQWSLRPQGDLHRLPQGLVLEPAAGIISGEPTPLARSSTFVVRVTDARGNFAERELEIRVVGEANLVISSRLFGEGISSQPYESCIEASGGDTSEAYGWEFDEVTIPSGLVSEGRGKTACLFGTPTACGNFMVGATVRDTAGQSFSTSIPLSIACDVIQIHTRFLRPLSRGESVDMQLSSNGGQGSVYSLVQGELPSGLTLSEVGRVSGVVRDGARAGTHDFIVRVADDEGRRGLTALTIRVHPVALEAIEETKTTTGCSAGGSGDGILASLSLLLVLGAGWRRRPAAEDRGVARRSSGSFAALAALLLVGAGGCADTTETIVHELCHQVQCDGGLECDPTDGNCKCGGLDGIFCEEREICLSDPTPRCVETSCDFVVCDRGQSCVEATGECACGGVSCAADEQCVDQACVALLRCDGVSCSKGMSCDPLDGQCKCDGASCRSDESCVEGSCELDLCAGVNCTLNSICDPADGSCHCAALSGPICARGEACGVPVLPPAVEEGELPFACLASDLCRDDSCGGGATCDPLDGLCRCGGVGKLAPICDQGQSCINGQCRGGMLCEPGGIPTVCSGGLSCDPQDGACKCGGAGGVICDEGSVCTADAGGFRCMDACTIEAGAGGTCGSGRGCYLDKALSHGGSFCAPSGPIGVNEPCEEFNDCAPGMYCSAANLCRRLCRPSDGPALGCGDAETYRCLAFTPEESDQPDLGYCMPGFG